MPGKLGAIKFEYSNADLDSFFDDDFDDWKDDTTDLDDLLEAGELDDSYNMNIATPSYQQGGKGYASSAVPSQNAMPKKLNRSYYDEDPSSGWKKGIKCLLVFLVITTMLIMQSARNPEKENAPAIGGDINMQNQTNSKNDTVRSTALPTLSPTTEGTSLPNDKVNPTKTPTDAEDSSGSSTKAEVNITTTRPTLSPIDATDIAVAPDLSKCTDVDEWEVGGNPAYDGLTCNHIRLGIDCNNVINMTDALHDGKTAAEACCQCGGGLYDTTSSPEDDNDGDDASKKNGSSSTNDIDDANKHSGENDVTDVTADDVGPVEEDGNIDVDKSVGEDITGLNVTDTVSSKNETAEENGNDTDPTSIDGGTVEKDGKDVADVTTTDTVNGDDESAEESDNDTVPPTDDNGKDDDHDADQQATDIVSDNNDDETAE